MVARNRVRSLPAFRDGVLVACAAALCACGSGGGAAAPVPFVEAGPGQVGRVNVLVTLDGSASRDPEGHALSFTWTQTSGPSAVLSDEHAAKPTFTPGAPGTYTVTLRTTTSDGRTSPPDDVTIVVVDDLSAAPRRPPAAEPRAGGLVHASFFSAPPVGVFAPPPTVVLADGSRRAVLVVDLAADPTDDPAPGSVAGLPRIDVVVAASPFAKLYAEAQPGDDDPVSLELSDGTSPPVVTYGVAGSSFVLDGTRSHDDQVVSKFTWTQVEGPFEFTTQDDTLDVVPTVPGTYVFELAVTDNVGLSSFPRKLRVPVLPTRSIGVGPPVARVAVASGAAPVTIGGVVTLTGRVGVVITLDGRGSVAQDKGSPGGPGAGLTFSWKQLEGPLADAIAVDGPLPQFTPNLPGAYEFELTVTDANGVSDSSHAWLSVSDAVASAPVAAIEPVLDAVIPPPGVPMPPLVLDGSHSQSKAAATFHWTQVRGPPVFVTDLGGGRGSVVPDQPGTYEFELRVFDTAVYSPPARRSFRAR